MIITGQKGGDKLCMSKPENTLESQLSAIDQSKTEILVLILATILSYYTVDIQRQQLVCTAAGQELCDCLPKNIADTGCFSILVISALKFLPVYPPRH